MAHRMECETGKSRGEIAHGQDGLEMQPGVQMSWVWKEPLLGGGRREALRSVSPSGFP